MTTHPNNRRIVSISMKPDLHAQLWSHCKEIDQPVTVFVRELIKKALLTPPTPPHPTTHD